MGTANHVANKYKWQKTSISRFYPNPVKVFTSKGFIDLLKNV